jgi:NAD(P)-dependent dehydrogenase (short-subunit alcohol dehydrogenase family)
MIETILVTGATGTVGSQVVRQLAGAAPDVNIKAAGHPVQKVQKVMKSDRVKSIQIDYNKPESLREALEDVDRVFLLTPFQPDMVQLSSSPLKEIDNTGDIIRKGYASQVSSAVEEVTGKRPISFSQFAKDYIEAFR